MANYSSLKSTINSNVNTNGTEAITGQVLNTVLNAMVTSLGAGYQYMGVATPSTNPGTPDQNVFYIAGTEGTYTNFNNIVVANEVAALVWNGSWAKQNTGIKFVSVSQNTNTGHTDITVGSTTTPVASVEEVSQLGQGINKILGEYAYNGVASTRPSFVIPGGIDVVAEKKITIKIVFTSATSADWSFGIRKQDDGTIFNFSVPSGTTTFETGFIPAVNYNDARVRVYTTENDKSFSISFMEVSSIESVEKNSLAIQNLLGEKGKETAFSSIGTFAYNSSLGKYVIDFPITFSYSKELPATFFVKSGNSIAGTTINLLNSNYNTIRTYSVSGTDYCNIALDNNSSYLRIISDSDLGTINTECIIGTYGAFIDYYISTFGLSFGGIVTPSSSIDLANTNVFYFANTPGRYFNFANDIVITQGDVVLLIFDVTTKRWDYRFVTIGEIKHQGYYCIKGIVLAPGYWNNEINRVAYHSNRVISPYIFVERGCRIINNIYCQVVLFDQSKTYQSNSWKQIDSVTEIQESSYIRLVFITEDGQSDYSNFDNSVSIIQANAYKEISRTRIESSKYGDFVRGYYNSNGTISSHGNRACSTAFYKVKKGDFVYMDSNNYQFQVVYWDDSKNWLNMTSKWCRREYIYPQYSNYSVGQVLINRDGYINIQMASLIADTMSDSEIAGLNDLIKIGHIERDFLNNKAWGIQSVEIVYKKPRFINTPAKVSQAGTFIDDNLWLFGETSEPIYVINPLTGENVSQKTQSLGHFSNADYNEVTDTLLTCGASDDKIFLQLYKSPAEQENLQKTDVGYLGIDITSLITNVGDWVIKNYTAMWGEDKDIVYLMLGAAESSTGLEPVYSNEHKIYRLQLGLGDNDLSADGFGDYNPGKEETEYNGTGKVLVTFVGNINEGIDTITNLDHRPYVQDAEYDGDIFIGFGIREHNFLRIRLDEATETFRVIENYQHKFFNYNRSTQLFYEPEVTAIHNGRLYCGSRNQYITPDSVLLSFEI